MAVALKLLRTLADSIRSPNLPLPIAERNILLRIGDTLVINLASMSALWLGSLRGSWDFSAEFLSAQVWWLILLNFGFYFLNSTFDAYDFKLVSNLYAGLISIVKVLAVLFIVYLILYFVLPPALLPRHVVAFFAVIFVASFILWRIAYVKIFSNSGFKQNVFIVGHGDAAQKITQLITQSLRAEYNVVGYMPVVDNSRPDKLSGLGLPRFYDNGVNLAQIVEKCGVSELILAPDDEQIPPPVLESLIRCQERGVHIVPMSLLYERITGRVAVKHIGNEGYKLLTAANGTTGWARLVKKIIDVLVALLGLMILGLLLPLIAILISLDSPGPIFYIQNRVGKAGKVFRLIKLRTMVIDAEIDGAPQWAVENDSRVTFSGRLLRKTRLDELPQLVNVLKGEMSLIGPRPERPEFVSQLEHEIPFYRLRHTVRPGLTGWSQVRHPYANKLDDHLTKLEYDLYYIRHWSLLLDLSILLRTAGVVLSLSGI
ncbi:MAG: exopolysaccharide biosynthesis polyprenyl glycosylphosphotransferase [Chloroflexota bacterium]